MKEVAHTVIFRKQIHSCFAGGASGDIYLIKKIELPFVPQKDMALKGGQWIEWEEIEEVVYDIEKDCFTAYVSDDKEIYEAQLQKKPHKTVEEVAQEWVSLGWEWEEKND